MPNIFSHKPHIPRPPYVFANNEPAPPQGSGRSAMPAGQVRPATSQSGSSDSMLAYYSGDGPSPTTEHPPSRGRDNRAYEQQRQSILQSMGPPPQLNMVRRAQSTPDLAPVAQRPAPPVPAVPEQYEQTLPLRTSSLPQSPPRASARAGAPVRAGAPARAQLPAIPQSPVILESPLEQMQAQLPDESPEPADDPALQLAELLSFDEDPPESDEAQPRASMSSKASSPTIPELPDDNRQSLQFDVSASPHAQSRYRAWHETKGELPTVSVQPPTAPPTEASIETPAVPVAELRRTVSAPPDERPFDQRASNTETAFSSLRRSGLQVSMPTTPNASPDASPSGGARATQLPDGYVEIELLNLDGLATARIRIRPIVLPAIPQT